MNQLQKVWICGANGRVGRQMISGLDSVETELFLTDADDVDVTDLEAVMEFANINRPHYIVNCAGYTDVKACEHNMEMAFKVNALGARNLSVAARKVSARMVQLSTDDVFDGNGNTPYTEFDLPNPRTIYGKSKLAGENFVKEFCDRHLIIRSSWIFGDGSPYPDRILALAKAGTPVKAAVDQIASPTGAGELAGKIIELMKSATDGLYHITGQGICTRYELVKEILLLAGSTAEVIPVESKEDQLTAMRPSYAVLDNLMLRISDIPLLPDWKSMLKRYINQGR